MTHRDFILKAIRIRKRLMHDGYSKLNRQACNVKMHKMKAWLDFYPNATEEQVSKFFFFHAENIRYILPGESCTAHNKLINQYTQLYDQANDYQIH